MCVIIYKSEKISLNFKTLALAVKDNPDGLGVAFFDNNEWIVRKTLNPTEKKIKEFLRLTEGKKTIFHARKATSGKIDLKNTHPFFDDNFILFHNGILPTLNGIDQNRSDSSLLFLLLKNNLLDKHQILKNLADKTHSRFLLIEKNKQPIFFGKWQNYQGLKVSNKTFCKA